ncbi:MAG: hypothetical protein COB33_015695 [Thiotrichaceae bacterium]|nr:hypothetical protein [Thiotrichaceae bacterium]PCI12815.1 MAG: hypothetical protein COB71_08015 [Thiotrichales bacterium]
MRKIAKKNVGEKLQILLEEKHPLEEDIGILNEKGELLGIVITKEAYDFFLKKVEEEEDRIDNKTIEAFHKSGEKYEK